LLEADLFRGRLLEAGIFRGSFLKLEAVCWRQIYLEADLEKQFTFRRGGLFMLLKFGG
jgi:hypothetical protein